MLDIHTTPAVVQIKNNNMRLKIHSTPAQMQVTRTRPTFRVVSQTQKITGAKKTNFQLQYQKMRAQQQLREGIRNVNNAYDDMAGMPLADQAAMMRAASSQTSVQDLVSNANAVDSQPVTVNRPQVEWENGSMEIEWVPSSVEMSWEGDYRPEITVTPHSVEIRLINGKTIRVRENEARAIEMRGEGKKIETEV